MTIYEELRLIRQSIEALRRRTTEDLDALAAQVDLLLPKKESDRSRLFKRFTKEDWGNYLDGGEEHAARRARKGKFKVIV